MQDKIRVAEQLATAKFNKVKGEVKSEGNRGIDLRCNARCK
jgi:hypothetical protein